jgi:hypothetical protein
MSGRIATAPARIGDNTVGDYRSRAFVSGQREPAQDHPDEKLPVLPEPAKPLAPAGTAPAEAPGDAFVAAIVAGTMPPQPLSAQEILLRSSNSWSPPDSELHLTDRTA